MKEIETEAEELEKVEDSEELINLEIIKKLSLHPITEHLI